MPKSLSAQAILFAINTALRLSRSNRRAYVNSLKSKTILLPIPTFEEKPNPFTINRFFEMEGAPFVEQIEALKFLHRKNQIELLSPEALEQYQEYYRCLFFILTAAESNEQIKQAGLRADDLLSLLKIRQWEKETQFATTTLQLVAGTIVEKGIHYFNQFPESIQSETGMGKALSKLLNALDTIPFNEEEDFKKVISQRIITSLFFTAVETIRELPKYWMRDEKIQTFIESATRGINEELYQRIGPELSFDETGEAIQWGELLLSSLIRHAGHFVFAPSNHLIDVNTGQEQLVKGTGLVIMDLLYAEDELGLNLRQVFTASALDTLVKNAFILFAGYPRLLSKDDHLSIIIKEISQALAKPPLTLARFLPGITELVLKKTNLHRPVIWEQEEEEPQNLLITALQLFLNALSELPEKSRSKFSPQQFMETIELLLDEVVQHPAWITSRIGEDRLLERLIQLSFEAVQSIPASQRSSMTALTYLLKINMRAITADIRILEKIKWAEDEEEKMILEKLIELVYEFIFHKASSNALNKTAQALNLLDYLAERILQRHPNQLGLHIAAFLFREDARLQLSNSLNRAPADHYINTILEMINTHPDIISPNPNIHRIITGVTESLQEAGLDRPGMLPGLLQLVLIQTAENIDLEVGDHDAKNELLEALRQILKALSFDPYQKQWKPVFKGDHILEIVLYLLGEVSENLDWLEGEQKIYTTLHIIFENLDWIPRHRSPSFSLIKLMIIKLFEAVKNHPAYLEKMAVDMEEAEKVVLDVALEQLFKAMYQPITIKASLDILHQSSVMDAILDYYLYRTSFHPLEIDAIREAADQLREAVRLLDEGHLNSAEEFLDHLNDNIA